RARDGSAPSEKADDRFHGREASLVDRDFHRRSTNSDATRSARQDSTAAAESAAGQPARCFAAARRASQMTAKEALDAAKNAEIGERLRRYEATCGPRGCCH